MLDYLGKCWRWQRMDGSRETEWKTLLMCVGQWASAMPLQQYTLILQQEELEHK